MFGIQKKDQEKAVEKVSEVTYLPAVDVTESASGYVIHADVPGANKDGVTVTYEDGVVTLNAKSEAAKTEKQGQMLHREFRFASYERSFSVGDDVDSEAISAEIANGVLKVTLPRKMAAKKTIPVSVK